MSLHSFHRCLRSPWADCLPQDISALPQSTSPQPNRCTLWLKTDSRWDNERPMLHQWKKKVQNKVFIVCFLWVLVLGWWDFQQRFFQQPKSFHTTSCGFTRTGAAAQNLPQTHLLLQVITHKYLQSHSSTLLWTGLKIYIIFSCLIAMALKNSKTGSLPVSEIYSFMKEHFPYFKVWSISNIANTYWNVHE